LDKTNPTKSATFPLAPCPRQSNHFLAWLPHFLGIKMRFL
jgi:hypothetical protein